MLSNKYQSAIDSWNIKEILQRENQFNHEEDDIFVAGSIVAITIGYCSR